MLLLTYKTHIDKKRLRDFLNEKRTIQKIVIGHETGDEECPYLHTHVAVRFEKALDSTNCRILDFDGIHPNIQKLAKMKDFMNAAKYCSKEDEDTLEEGFEAPTIETRVEKIIEYNDVMDAIKTCTDMKEVLATIQIWNLGHKQNERHLNYIDSLKSFPFRGYQQEWYDALISQGDRKVLWIYDEIGNTGKTFFIKKLIAEHPGEVYMMTSKQNDNAFRYEGQEFVVLNLTRTTQEYVPYGSIEAMKDGLMASGKYTGKQNLYAPPKVVIFANWPPNEEAMSLDRWHIIEYGGGANNIMSPADH